MPRACDLLHSPSRIELLQLVVEPLRLGALVDDDLVRVAPPDLERHPRVRDLGDPMDRGPEQVGVRVGARRAADLETRERLQGSSARNARELLIAKSEVGDGIEGDGSCEEMRVLTEEQERLLPTHAASDGVDAARVAEDP